MAPCSGQAEPDPAKESTITKYLPLVRFVAEKVHRRLPPGVDLESLVHSGVIGLLEALDRFDPKRGVEFEVYARYRIQGEVMQCLRSLDWVSRSVRSWGRKMESARVKLAGQLVREPTADEMANELAIPLDNYYRLDQQLNDATLLSLEDLSVGSANEREGSRRESIQNLDFDPLTLVESKDLIDKLGSAVKDLPERERLVITLYYHEELTLKEIGADLASERRSYLSNFRSNGGALAHCPGYRRKAQTRRQARRRDAQSIECDETGSCLSMGEQTGKTA